MAALRGQLPALGLRWRLAAWVAAVMLACTGVTFAAVYGGIASQVRGQIDRDLAGDVQDLGREISSAPASSPAQVANVAARYIHRQPFSPTLLALMGIASGTYVSLKIPEQQTK